MGVRPTRKQDFAAGLLAATAMAVVMLAIRHNAPLPTFPELIMERLRLLLPAGVFSSTLDQTGDAAKPLLGAGFFDGELSVGAEAASASILLEFVTYGIYVASARWVLAHAWGGAYSGETSGGPQAASTAAARRGRTVRADHRWGAGAAAGRIEAGRHRNQGRARPS